MKKEYLTLILVALINVNCIYSISVKEDIVLCKNLIFENIQDDSIPCQNIKSILSSDWDTIITFVDTVNPHERHTRTYDINGYMISGFQEIWQNNSWTNRFKLTYTNDINGKMLNLLAEVWQSSSWVNYIMHTYTYDTNGNQLIDLYEMWQTNTWVNSYKWTNTYSTFNKKTNVLREGWNNSWEIVSRDTFIYDINENLLSQTNESWFNNAWLNTEKWSYTYNINNLKITNFYETWQSGWVNRERDTLYYDINNNLEYILKWRPSLDTSIWVPKFKNIYTYDITGNMLSDYSLIYQDPIWNYQYRFIYTFDTNNTSTTGQYEIWQITNWQPSLSSLNFYSNNSIIIYFPYIHRYVTSWNVITNQSILNTKNNAWLISPNPVYDVLTIYAPSGFYVEIFDIYGKLFKSYYSFENKMTLDISELTNGTYILKCYSENNLFIKKIIKL